MTKRPRTEIELRFLSDCVYSAIVEYGQSKLPLCKYTLAHLYFSEFHGRVEDHVNQFPQHFGYLRDFLNRKNFNRFIGHVKSLADDKDVLNSLKESYRNTQIRFSHENSSPLVEGIPCNVCFNTPTTNIVDDIKSRCKKLLTDFSNKELACGNNFKEIHECICETSFQILSSYDKSIENFKNSFDELKVEFQRYKLELTDNLAKFDDHLKEVSAVIHYGSGLSGSGVQHLDRTIFCREFTKKDIEQHLSNLPDYRHIKSSDPNVEFGDLFHEYCSHVLTHLCEPSFFKLGQKYSLTGIKGGSSAARLSEHAQSICLNYLLFPCNHGIYSELRPILAVHSNARTRYTPHPLVDGLSIPRLPSVSEADEKVEILRELQSILLGTPQIPVHYEGWDLVKSCPKQVAANSRLVDLMSIRKHSLSFQSDNKFLKAKSTEHYQNLSIDEVKSTLKIYSLICESDFQKYDENKLNVSELKVKTFTNDLSSLLINLMTRLEPQKLVVIGLLPRAYCKYCHNELQQTHCKNIHLGGTSIMSSNIFINKLNVVIKDFTLKVMRVRFPSSVISFVSFREAMFMKGTVKDLFGGHLELDGLHLSEIGNDWLDNILTDCI